MGRATRLAVAMGLAASMSAVPGAPALAAAPDFPDGFAAHHTYAEVRAELRAVAERHPDIVRLRSMGRTHEGRLLSIVKISDHVRRDEPEPEVYVDGGIHAQEHLSTEQALALIRWLVDGYGTDPRATAIVRSTEIWIAPLLNPDGAAYDIAGGTFRGWRKDREPNPGTDAVGTDINRNFPFAWGCCGGSSDDPAHRFYRGLKPLSTREAVAIRDFVRGRVIGGRQQLRLALTMHSHGEFVMFPFSHTAEAQPPQMRLGDRSRLRSLAQGIATRDGYRAVQAGRLYTSEGVFMDWAYVRFRIFALTLELAPPADVEGGWYVPDAEVGAELERNRDALLWFLEQARTVPA